MAKGAIAGLLAVLIMPQSAAQLLTVDTDRYLQQIEIQAKEQAATADTPGSRSSAVSSSRRTRLPPGLTLERFEAMLAEEFGGTYRFYQRLEPDNRQRVFEHYRQDNRAGAIREYTLKLLSGAAP